MGGQSIDFGPFSFDPTAMRLVRDGVSVNLGARAAALLTTLLEAQGNVVTKDALLEAAWPGMVVEESNLAVQIAALRKALGGHQSGAEWIVTVPRLGYRVPAAAAALAGETEMRRPALAVLPFQILGPDLEQEYFADGIVEDITTALGRFKSFAVISRNSAFAYKGRTVDVRLVGKELGVRYILEGSVRAAGDQLRISAQLVEAETGLHLWAHRFDGTRADVFAVQDRITEGVVAAIQPSITHAEVERARLKRTSNLTAYDLYLQALTQTFFRQGVRITDLLEEALRLDPNFAMAAAVAGVQYVGHYFHQVAGASIAARDRGDELLTRVLPLCGNDSTLLAMCGMGLCASGDFDRGLSLALQAVTENPNDLMALMCAGVVCLVAGDLGLATQYQLKALTLSPNEYWAHGQLTCIAHIRMAEGAYEEALEWAKRSLAVSPHYTPTLWMLIAGNAHLGRMEEAHHYVAELQRLNPGLTISRLRLGQRARDMRRVEVLFEGLRLAGMPET